MIKVTLSNQLLKRITAIEEKKVLVGTIHMPVQVGNRLRKNSKKELLCIEQDRRESVTMRAVIR